MRKNNGQWKRKAIRRKAWSHRLQEQERADEKSARASLSAHGVCVEKRGGQFAATTRDGNGGHLVARGTSISHLKRCVEKKKAEAKEVGGAVGQLFHQMVA